MHPFLCRPILAASLRAGPAAAQLTSWNIDSGHSNAQFAVRHMMVTNVRGQFGRMSGTVQWDPKDLAKTAVETTIDATTIDTRNAKRDAHLKSPDFFDVEKFPSLAFKSVKVDRAGEGRLRIAGELTIHGVTKPVVLDVEGPTPEIKGPGGRARMGASATTRINRKDFGLQWNRPLEAGGWVVGDEVSITIDVELIQQSATAGPSN
jgi:polyisoprenoid-binding protein YceI